MGLNSTQKGVAKGMALAAIASLGIWMGAVLLLHPPEISNSPTDRVAYTLPWQLFPLVSLFIGIAWLARYRFFNQSAIHGNNDASDGALMAGRAYLENTSEQVLLFFVTQMVLSIVLPINWLQVLPVLAVWFLFCRILFAIGYSRGAPSRAFGFAGTFYPTVLGMIIAAWFSIFRV